MVGEVSLQLGADASSCLRARGPPSPPAGRSACEDLPRYQEHQSRATALPGWPPAVCTRCLPQGGHLHPPVETLRFLRCRLACEEQGVPLCPRRSPGKTCVRQPRLLPSCASHRSGEGKRWLWLIGYIYWNHSWQSGKAGRAHRRDDERPPFAFCGPFHSPPQPGAEWKRVIWHGVAMVPRSARWHCPPRTSPYKTLAPLCWGDSLATDTDASGESQGTMNSQPTSPDNPVRILNFLPFVNICWQWIIKVAQAPALAEPTLIPHLGPSVMDLHIKPLTEGWIANIIICAAFFSPVEDELQLLPSISFFQVIFILQFPLTPKRVKNRSISFQFQTGRGKEPGERQRMPFATLSTCLSVFLPTPPARSSFRACECSWSGVLIPPRKVQQAALTP